MKILVVSDIHSYVNERAGAMRPSYVKVGDLPADSPTHHFVEYIKLNHDLHPDVVVCGGDLGDQANSVGIQHSWEFLNKLCNISSGALLLSTVGNHDLDSRFSVSEFDAKGILQGLHPRFPAGGALSPEDIERLHCHFWTYNFYSTTKGNVRFVVLNSAAFHGYGKEDKREHEHGRISDVTIKNIKRFIEDEGKKLPANQKPVMNVLICHHHLVKDGAIDDPDYSEMKGGHALVQMLSDSDYGRWLVIHGHRHRARLFSIADSTGPFVLSAASFGATKSPDYDASPNQAHLIEIDVNDMRDKNLIPSGKIKSFTWSQPMRRWLHKGAEGGGLPPETNFGFKGTVDELAAQINAQLQNNIPVQWDQLVSAIPKLRYLHHDQVVEVQKTLRNTFSINLSMDADRLPMLCGRSG